MNQFSRWLARLTGSGDLRQGAELVVAAAFAEPDESDVAWLDEVTPDHDADHARWELRYARRALVYHAARRDSLDDRTPAAVAHALEEALAHDPHADAALRDLSDQQFNTRLRTYGQALDDHDARSVTERLGHILLTFGGARNPDADQVRRAGLIMVKMLRESNANLRRTFGGAKLQEAGDRG